jgi:hypothetical protein
MPVAIQDRRRDSEALMVFGAPDEETYCLVRLEQGRADVLSSGASGGAFVRGVELAMTWWSAYQGGGIAIGRAGPNVARVVIETAPGVTIEASVGSERFAAWWEASGAPRRILAYDRAGTTIASVADPDELGAP